MRSRVSIAVSVAALSFVGLLDAAPASTREIRLPVTQWRVIERESGPVNYYTLFDKAAPAYIRGHYRPELRTVVLGHPLAESDRPHVRRLRWRWRAVTLPGGGNECVKAKNDSAAVVYVTWRRTLRWYTLKYVWSASAKKGAICDRKRNAFVAQDTIVLRSGGPLNTWVSEDVDLRDAFRAHFEDGDPDADVPDLVGIGLMTDGDQTQTESVADYADFVATR